MEYTTTEMLRWINQHTDPIARAIQERIQLDAERIADLTNDRDNIAAELRLFRAEVAWQTR